MIIKFVKHYSVYSKDQLAGFPEDTAKLLIKQGIAEEYTETVLPKSVPLVAKVVRKTA